MLKSKKIILMTTFSLIAIFISGVAPQAIAHTPTAPIVSLSGATETSVNYSFSGASGTSNNVEQHHLEVKYCTGSGCDPFDGSGTPIGSGTYQYCTGNPCNAIVPSGSGQISPLACVTSVTLGARERHAGGDWVYATPATLSTLACDGGGGGGGGGGDPVQTFNPGTINRKTNPQVKDWTANTRITNYGTSAPDSGDVSVSIQCGGTPIIFQALSVHLDGTTLVTKLNMTTPAAPFPLLLVSPSHPPPPEPELATVASGLALGVPPPPEPPAP